MSDDEKDVIVTNKMTYPVLVLVDKDETGNVYRKLRGKSSMLIKSVLDTIYTILTNDPKLIVEEEERL